MMVPFKQVIASLLILLIAAPRNGFSQPGILWENSFGGTYTDQGVAVLETQDGGFLALCMPYSLDGDVSGSNGKSEFWLLKLDNAGQLVWKKTYGGSNEETPRKPPFRQRVAFQVVPPHDKREQEPESELPREYARLEAESELGVHRKHQSRSQSAYEGDPPENSI